MIKANMDVTKKLIIMPMLDKLSISAFFDAAWAPSRSPSSNSVDVYKNINKTNITVPFFIVYT